MTDPDRDLDVLPRRPFVLLPPEPGGFEAALARGRRRRRRTAGSSVLASVVAIVLAVTLSAPNPDGAARLEFAPAAPGDLTTDAGRPGVAEPTPEPLALDAPAQPAEVRRGPSSRLDAEPAPAQAAAGPSAARPTSPRRSTPAGRRRLDPPKEDRNPGGYAACAANDDFRVPDRWCLQARYYRDSGNDKDKPDSRVALEICRSVDTANGTLTYPTSQPVDFEIVQKDVVVWQWSYNAVFDRVTNTDAVSPGDCLMYEVPWGDVDNSTPQKIVDPGNYLLRATGLASELGSANKAEINITVYA